MSSTGEFKIEMFDQNQIYGKNLRFLIMKEKMCNKVFSRRFWKILLLIEKFIFDIKD